MDGSLQVAQVLADLSALHAAEEKRASALLSVNGPPVRPRTVIPATAVVSSAAAPAAAALAPPSRPGAAPGSYSARSTSPAARFDGIGRLFSPPLTRANSANGSMPGTPRRESDNEDDPLHHASMVMMLQDIREKLKDQDNNLNKTRQRFSALMAARAAQAANPKSGLPATPADDKAALADARPTRYNFPKS